MRIFCTLGLAALLAVAQAHAGQEALKEKGQKGKDHGHKHSSSSSSSSSSRAYDAAYSDNIDTPQMNFVFDQAVPVSFSTNQWKVSKNIDHPLRGDSTDSQFRIKITGVYLLGWTMTVNSTNDFDVPIVQLFNWTKNTVVSPNPFQATTTYGDPTSLSGQTIVHLDEGTVLQLQVISQDDSETNGLQVFDQTFFITKIAG